MNEFVVTINEKKIQITLSNEYKAVLNRNEFSYTLSKLNDHTYNLTFRNKSYLISISKNGNSEYLVFLNGQVFETKVLSALQEKAANLIESSVAKHSATAIKSPMPGMILKVKKQAGEEVNQGDSLLILEAMKMENDIKASVSGKIKELKVKEGQPVEKGMILLIIG